MKTVIATTAIAAIALALGCAPADESPATNAATRLEGPGASITRDEVVERARAWTAAGVPYCGGLPGGGDALCGGTCNRGAGGSATRRLDWDRYRSDCSGFVSYAWGLAPPGLTTWTLPGVSERIAMAELAAGDIFLSSSHTMIFLAWAAPGVARFAEEASCGLAARVREARVSEASSRVTVSGWGSFEARRYQAIRDVADVPFEAAPRPDRGPFPALEVRQRIGSEAWITWCDEGGQTERVWQTAATGPHPDARWATALYAQGVGASCGERRDGVHPLVFRSLRPGQLGAWIVACTGRDHQAAVFHAQGETVDDRPAAPFSHYEATEGCP